MNIVLEKKNDYTVSWKGTFLLSLMFWV